MSYCPWKTAPEASVEGVGAPISPSPAGNLVRTADEGKIHFSISAPDAEILDPVPEKIIHRTEIHPGDPVKEDRPEWRPRKKPHGKGYKNNAAAIAEVNRQIDENLPTPAPLPKVPSKHKTPEFKEGLLEFVCAGGTVNQYCKRVGVVAPRVSEMLREDAEFKAQLMAAREAGFDSMAEEALRIATEPCLQAEEVITYDKDGNVLSRAVKRSDAVYARKLAFQARLQLLAKWAPNKYGEKPMQEDNESRATKILEARRRVANGDA